MSDNQYRRDNLASGSDAFGGFGSDAFSEVPTHKSNKSFDMTIERNKDQSPMQEMNKSQNIPSSHGLNFNNSPLPVNQHNNSDNLGTGDYPGFSSVTNEDKFKFDNGSFNPVAQGGFDHSKFNAGHMQDATQIKPANQGPDFFAAGAKDGFEFGFPSADKVDPFKNENANKAEDMFKKTQGFGADADWDF